MPTRIDYVVDDPNWVQAARRHHLQRHLPEIALVERSAPRFARRWKWLRRRPTAYFGTWRLLRDLRGPLGLADDHLAKFMTSVTSHYEVGGGLAIEKAIPAGTDPGSCLEEAVAILRACKVVTVNSPGLRELIGPHVPGLVYAPNGVDAEFFSPPPSRSWDPCAIRVGWVGKVKAAKNFETISEVAESLRGRGFEFEIVTQRKGGSRRALLRPGELRDLYRRIDFYLCASWHEGTPNPALEAAACGTPLITTRVGNMPELVSHGVNGYFVEPNAESIRAALVGVRELDADRYGRMSAAMRAEIERAWTWDRAAERYRSAFERLVD